MYGSNGGYYLSKEAREFNRNYVEAIERNAYIVRRNRPAVELMALESRGILNRRFRPEFMQYLTVQAVG
jgi:hypothetical protein